MMTPENALTETFDNPRAMRRLDPEGRRRRIEEFERALESLPGVKENVAKILEASTFHHHCAGVYCREYVLPAGFAVTGRVHRYPCFNVVLVGDIVVAMGELSEPVRMEAGTLFISQAGEKKALYANEDSVFLTFHATEETDPDKIWEEFTFATVDDFIDYTRALEGPED